MRRITPWAKVVCDQCGMEFTGARSFEVSLDDEVELLCPECTAWWRGYEEAQQEIELERLGRELAVAAAAQVMESIGTVGEAAPRMILALARSMSNVERATHANKLGVERWQQAYFGEQRKSIAWRVQLSNRIERLQQELAERNAALEEWCGR